MCSLPPRAWTHVSELRGPRGHLGQWVHTHWPSHLFCFSPGFRAAPTSLHLSMLPGSALAVPRLGAPPIVITLGVSFPDWPTMERKASDDRKQTAAQSCPSLPLCPTTQRGSVRQPDCIIATSLPPTPVPG